MVVTDAYQQKTRDDLPQNKRLILKKITSSSFLLRSMVELNKIYRKIDLKFMP
jgi:hypothetical protein